MKFLHESVGKASSYVVEELRQNGGVGGVITLDSEGNCGCKIFYSYCEKIT